MKYKVLASEIVFYAATVDAKDEHEAIEIARVNDNWIVIDNDGWSFDEVILEN